MAFAERVKEIMVQRGLSQAQVELKTKLLGRKVSQSHLSRITSGDQIPSLDRAVAIAQALDVSLEWLATGKTCQPQQIDPYEQELLDAFRSVANKETRLLMLDLMKHQAHLAKQRE